VKKISEVDIGYFINRMR